MLSDRLVEVVSREGGGGHKDEHLHRQAMREVIHLSTECKRRVTVGEGQKGLQ